MEGQLSLIAENLFQQKNEHIIICNCDGQLKHLNEQIKETLQKLDIQASFFELINETNEDWKALIQNVKEQRYTQKTFYLNGNLGGQVALELNGYYIKEKDFIYIRPQFHTVQSILTAQQREIQMLNSMSHGVILATLKGKIIATNNSSLQLLGFEQGQLEKTNYERLFEYCYYEPKAIIHYYRAIATNQLATIVVKRINEEGQTLYLNIESKINDTLGLLVTTITDQTEKMTLLETINHQKSLSVVGQNVATIIHEIRNPITSIQGFLQMIKQEIQHQANTYFQIVESELQRIDDMLLELLTLSKPKKYEVKAVDLKEIVKEVLAFFQERAAQLQAKMVLECEEATQYLIEGNYNRLKQMVINLLKNALEAIDSKCYIFIRLLEVGENTLRLIIEDEGRGMSAQQLKQVFNTFYTTKEYGTGLGMVLVQDVVAEHNATIAVESNEGVGTRFTIDFTRALVPTVT